MKIEFEVPEWAIGKHIYIFAGAELLAKKEVIISHKNDEHVSEYLPLLLKPIYGRCNGCGECCKGCPFLNPDGCSFKGRIPFTCLKSICTEFEGCTEKLEVVE